jgi:ATP-dependent DNA helicase RecG
VPEHPLFYDLAYLKGIGPQRAGWIQTELGLKTFYDLLTYFPYKYLDRSEIYPIETLTEGPAMVQARGKILRIERTGSGKASRLVATLVDSHQILELVWFQSVKWAEDLLRKGEDYLVFGKVTRYKGQLQMAHPELTPWEEWNKKSGPSLSPMYSLTDKLRQRNLNNRWWMGIVRQAMDQVRGNVSEILPTYILESESLPSRWEAIEQAHFPSDNISLSRALSRFKLEELFFLQFGVLRLRNTRRLHNPGPAFEKVGDRFLRFYHEHLPFELTDAQKRVIKEIRIDLGSGKQMNRLLQGDVGSGKTMVALMSMLLATDNGYQACLMAPTELLARQHYDTIQSMLGDLPVRCALLTGQVKGKIRKELLHDLFVGNLNLLVGTHALIQEHVHFERLGLAVIDEQHRFGVEQRAKLWSKAGLAPHILVMTATPIPRTLAMTRYGDLEVSIMNQLPVGRKPIQTVVTPEAKRIKMFAFLEQQMQLGRQVYVVYPAIKETEQTELKFLYDGYEAMLRAFPPPRFRLAVVHGQMKSPDREMEMQRFVKGAANLLVATTVIEVGVNVPNASVMVVENAERFGLAQLHQLRGRVGRGSEQSYCILMHKDKPNEEAMQRLQALASTNDGFEIAELDLKMRGPGDLAGTQQSGSMELKFSDLVQDSALLHKARQLVEQILASDPDGVGELTGKLVTAYSRFYGQGKNWSKIS